CAVGLRCVTIACPSTLIELAPCRNTALSIAVFDTTPFKVPASSPDVREISVCTVQTLRFRIRTRDEHVLPSAWLSMAMFGNGVGTGGAGGAGTLHTSGIAIACPPPLVLAGNTLSPPSGSLARARREWIPARPPSHNPHDAGPSMDLRTCQHPLERARLLCDNACRIPSTGDTKRPCRGNPLRAPSSWPRYRPRFGAR